MSEEKEEVVEEQSQEALTHPAILVTRIDADNLNIQLLNEIDPYSVPSLLKKAVALYEERLGI